MCWIGILFNMEEEKYWIPLFDGNSYPDWKFCMTIYLDKLDLLRHTETPPSKLLEEYPEPENTEAALRTARNGLIWNDDKCKCRIIKRIQDAQLEYVKGQETAYDVWKKKLQNVFEAKGMTSRAQ
jgi:hypothetical protein